MVRSFRKNRQYTYVLSDSALRSEEFGVRTMYGISIIGDSETVSIEDISDDFCFVSHLFDLIVEEELYPEHLHDVVEDFLSSYDPKVIPLTAGTNAPYTA